MCHPSTSLMAPCSESCSALLVELREGFLWLSPLPLSISLSPSLSLFVSPLRPANTSHSFYPGFPPVAHGATSALRHPCQLLLPTKSAVHQFVPECPFTAQHSCVFGQENRNKRKHVSENQKKHAISPCILPYTAFLQIAPR